MCECACVCARARVNSACVCVHREEAVEQLDLLESGEGGERLLQKVEGHHRRLWGSCVCALVCVLSCVCSRVCALVCVISCA